MVPRWQYTPRPASAVDEWIRREFEGRGLTPPHCTPEALAQALERERQIIITFHPHASDDPGVYGLLYRQEGAPPHYMIVFRPTHSIALRRLILFHELAHLLFEHPCTEVAGGQQFPLMPRKSYVTMGANSSLSVSTIRLCLLM